MAANKNATMSGVFAMHANLHNFLSGSLILCVEILDNPTCNARSRIHQKIDIVSLTTNICVLLNVKTAGDFFVSEMW